jgi:LysM repeat protein
VDAAHRCHARTPPEPIERSHQARFCLTSDYPSCEWFIARADGAATHELARAGIGAGLVSTRLSLAPDPTWRGIAGRAPVGRRGVVAAVAAGGLAIAAGAAAVAWTGLGSPGATPPGVGASSPTASPSDSPRPTATQEPTASPTTTPSATAAPTPTLAPTVAPTTAPTAIPQQTYTVVQGDTLAAIAERFGTTVAALQAANGIEDPDEIIIGQVLLIP